MLLLQTRWACTRDNKKGMTESCGEIGEFFEIEVMARLNEESTVWASENYHNLLPSTQSFSSISVTIMVIHAHFAP